MTKKERLNELKDEGKFYKVLDKYFDAGWKEFVGKNGIISDIVELNDYIVHGWCWPASALTLVKKAEPEQPFKKGELIEVWDNEDETPSQRKFYACDPSLDYPYVVYAEFEKTIVSYKYARKIQPVVEVTLQEIAEWRGCAVDQVVIPNLIK